MAEGTFLVANIRGYARFTQERGNEEAAKLDGQFAELVHRGIETFEGIVASRRSSEIVAFFNAAIQGVRAAVDLQKHFSATLALPVGIGLAEGSYARAGIVYVGMTLTLAERLCGLAGPGEILVDESFAHSLSDPPTVSLVDRGLVQLKGLQDVVRVVQVLWPGAESDALGNAFLA